jgi:hypothetical protein
MKLSARNQITGTVTAIDKGVTTTIVRLDCNGTRSPPRSPTPPPRNLGWPWASPRPRSSRPRT